MNAYRSSEPSNNWLTALKIIVLVAALYLSIFVLGKVFIWVLAVVFAIVKVAAFIVMVALVMHFFLKLLFQFDLLRFVFGNRFKH